MISSRFLPVIAGDDASSSSSPSSLASPSSRKLPMDPLLVALFGLPPSLIASSPASSASSSSSSLSTFPCSKLAGCGTVKFGGASSTTSEGDEGTEQTDASLLHGESISLTDNDDLQEFFDASSRGASSVGEGGSGNGVAAASLSLSAATTSKETKNKKNANTKKSGWGAGWGVARASKAVTIAVDDTIDESTEPPSLSSCDEVSEMASKFSHGHDFDANATPSKKNKKKKRSYLSSASKKVKKMMGAGGSSGGNHNSGSGESIASIDSSKGGGKSRSTKRDDHSWIHRSNNKQKGCRSKLLDVNVIRIARSNSDCASTITSFDHSHNLQYGEPQTPSTLTASTLSPDQFSTLEEKITNTRRTIARLQNTIHTAREELAAASVELDCAVRETAQLQRATLEADVGLARLTKTLTFADTSVSGVSTTSSGSSTSGGMYYLTPNSSLVDSGEDDNDHDDASFGDAIECSGDAKTPVTRNKKRARIQHGADGDDDTINTSATAASSAVSRWNEKEVEEERCPKEPVFIRTHDLALATTATSTTTESSASPLAQLRSGPTVVSILQTLHTVGRNAALDESSHWIPVRDTEKILAKRAKCTDLPAGMGGWENAASGTNVFVWSCKSRHDGHGKEYPMVKARGIVPASAFELVELLLDSARVKDYNKMSLGRVDEHLFHIADDVDDCDENDNNNDDGSDEQRRQRRRLRWNSACPRTEIRGEAKIVRSTSQPPLVRKPLEMRTLLHIQRLDDGEERGERDNDSNENNNSNDGGETYILTSRSVWETTEGTRPTTTKKETTTRCEMLLGVNLIRTVPGPTPCCEITTVTHVVSPGIPVSMGKRIGLVAAGNFVRDIRAVFETK